MKLYTIEDLAAGRCILKHDKQNNSRLRVVLSAAFPQDPVPCTGDAIFYHANALGVEWLGKHRLVDLPEATPIQELSKFKLPGEKWTLEEFRRGEFHVMLSKDTDMDAFLALFEAVGEPFDVPLQAPSIHGFFGEPGVNAPKKATVLTDGNVPDNFIIVPLEDIEGYAWRSDGRRPWRHPKNPDVTIIEDNEALPDPPENPNATAQRVWTVADFKAGRVFVVMLGTRVEQAALFNLFTLLEIHTPVFTDLKPGLYGTCRLGRRLVGAYTPCNQPDEASVCKITELQGFPWNDIEGLASPPEAAISPSLLERFKAGSVAISFEEGDSEAKLRHVFRMAGIRLELPYRTGFYRVSNNGFKNAHSWSKEIFRDLEAVSIDDFTLPYDIHIGSTPEDADYVGLEVDGHPKAGIIYQERSSLYLTIQPNGDGVMLPVASTIESAYEYYLNETGLNYTDVTCLVFNYPQDLLLWMAE